MIFVTITTVWETAAAIIMKLSVQIGMVLSTCY